MRILGIDNGFKGGLVLIENHKIIEAEVMPVIKVGKYNEYDMPKIKEYLKYWEIEYAVIEKTQAYPKQGGRSNHSTGRGGGLVEGLLFGLDTPFSQVHPKTWQKVMFEGMAKTDTKQMSYLVCSRLWSCYDWKATPRCKKPHDGLTDAAMLAEYGRRTYKL